MKSARLWIDLDAAIGTVDRRLFGGFVEHLGRAIYGGLYDPESAHADDLGRRADVLLALKQLDFTILRYPGGNFASGYHWQDGVGPREARKRVLDVAWNSLEPNLFGTDEFLQLSADMGWEPMLTVNLGSGTSREAAAWVAYCSERRPAVRVWGLGNEMDGDWQIGHAPAPQYVARAKEAALAMRAVDPEIELVACGSSNPEMTTWLEWDRTVLEGLHDVADYISLHRYAGKRGDDSEDFLAITNDIDRQIESIDAICRAVATESGRPGRTFLCFDEWNVWYRTAFKRFSDGGGTFAPPLIEEVYNLEDALVVAGFLNSFVRHADVVRIANLAQIVNAIAPLMTVGDSLLTQSIYWPFEMFSRRRDGISLRLAIDSPTFNSRSYGRANWLDASAIVNGSNLSVFLVNRGAQSLDVAMGSHQSEMKSVRSAEIVTAADLSSTNSLERPDEVAARSFEEFSIDKSGAHVALPPYSFVAATFEIA